MPINHSPRAPHDFSAPRPWAFCDRCNFVWGRADLQEQLVWSGNALVSTGALVCPRCLDVPNEGLRSIIIGPDPIPVENPRPGYQNAEQGATPVFSIQEILPD